MGLTVRQSKFVDYYVELGNGTQAAIQAGYSANVANRRASYLLSNSDIRAAIDAKLKAMESERVAAASEVLEYLTSVMRGESEEEEIVVESCGGGESSARIVTKHVSAKDRIKSAELLGKRYGLFTERVSIADDIPAIVDDVRDEAYE